MGVYIKSGAKIPTCCADCRYVYGVVFCVCGQGKAHEWDYTKSRHEDCPLVAVREPHGRLIDENAIVNLANLNMKVKGIPMVVMEELEFLPTVIEGSDKS